MKILTIFLKELKEALRDKKSLRSMILIPLFLFPAIILITAVILKYIDENVKEKIYYVGIYNPDSKSNITEYTSDFAMQDYKIILVPIANKDSLIKYIKEDSIQVGLVTPPNYQENLDNLKTAKLNLYLNQAHDIAPVLSNNLIQHINQKALLERYKKLDIDILKLTPVQIEQNNVADERETIGKMVGGYLPYIFIIMCFTGCVNLAIDLFTGEKERGTLETILCTPVSRMHILTGKLLMIVVGGLISLTSNFVGIFISYQYFASDLGAEFRSAVDSILNTEFVVMMYLLLIPLIIFFAGLLITITVRANTFKEGQAKIAPLNFIVILPAMIGTFPGIELDLVTSLIPIINIVLTIKEYTANTLELKWALVSVLSMIAYAAIAVLISYKSFGRESNLLK